MTALTRSDITIAITVYDRSEYVCNAIRSALDQNGTPSPQVVVAEDCGPNESLREKIVAEFGERVRYLRNPKRRGLFDNWNACIEACRTSWLCILHDDDSLEPNFVESMLELAAAAPGRALYYGQCDVVDDQGRRIQTRPRPNVFSWHELPLDDWVRYDPVCFPGQLFNVEAARQLGGFRAQSHYTADWEMWFKLALHYGAAATNRGVATYREHHSVGRGTTAVDLAGRKYAYVNMQRKRHVAWLRQKKTDLRFDRHALLQTEPMPTRFILQHGQTFSPRMLRYNAGLFFLSSPPHLSYRLLQYLSRALSWRSLGVASMLYRSLKG